MHGGLRQHDGRMPDIRYSMLIRRSSVRSLLRNVLCASTCPVEDLIVTASFDTGQRNDSVIMIDRRNRKAMARLLNA